MSSTRSELQAAHVLENVDRVPGDPAVTEYRRGVRYRQAWWRERVGLPIGRQPIRGGPGARLLGSRIDLEFAKESGANFLNRNALEAARARVKAPERHQMLDEARLWADLLSSMPMCFNLLGDLRADPALADRVVRQWFPDVAGSVREVRFEWSPGRLDPAYLGNRTAFDAALLLDLVEGGRGVVAVETKYHEHPTVEKEPSSDRLARYVEVTERSGIFPAGATQYLVGTPLQQIWLDHLLVLAMLQHPSRQWRSARFVLVHPSDNVGFARAGREYADLLVDATTFDVRTLEDLLDAEDFLETTAAPFRDRYLDRHRVTA